MQAGAKPPDALEVLNRLRSHENRKPIEKLPEPYTKVSAEQLQSLIVDWEKQIEVHVELAKGSQEYNNRIILNETEYGLHVLNKRNPDKPINYVNYNNVAIRDRDLYFPDGNKEKLAFVTDTKATYIQSVTVTTVNDQTICLGKHTIPDCIAYIPGPAELTPKPKKKKRTDIVDHTLILESKLRSGDNKPNEPEQKVIRQVVATNIENKDQNLIDLNLLDKDPEDPDAQQSFSQLLNAQEQKLVQAKKEIPDSLIHVPPASETKETQTEIQKSLDKFPTIRKSSSSSSLSSTKSSIEKYFKSPLDKLKKLTKTRPKKMPRGGGEDDDETVRQMEAKVSELIKKQMEETFAATGKRRPLTNPPPLIGDPNDLSSLRQEIDILKAQQQPPRPTASTDKQDIQQLKQNLVEMANYMQKLQEAVEHNRLSPEEKQKLKMMTGPTSTFGNPLVYKLNYPENIISDIVFRSPLNILKAPTVIATVGTFDPDINPKADFRDTWERMQNYTRNYDLYEHEYVDMLMALMKGSAATCLTDMIREYNGNLSKILEGLQDIYVPQHTIFDDMDAMNKFTRPAHENIKSTIRRASLLIHKMKPNCSTAAWPERKYHMLLALIKQLIERDTFQHLYAKELECIQAGTQLDIPAVTTIIALYEQTHDTIPKREMRLQYCINSMQIINRDNKSSKPIKTMTVKEKPKRSGMKTRSTSKELISSPISSQSQNVARGRSTDRNKYDKTRQINDSRSRSASTSYSQNYSQRNSQGERDYKKKPQSYSDNRNRNRPRSQSYDRNKNQSQSMDRQRSQSRENNYRNKYSKPNRYNNSNNNNNNPKSNKNSNDKGKVPYEKKFKHGKNQVTLHFYKCQACPSMHPTGSNCDKKDTLTSLNM